MPILLPVLLLAPIVEIYLLIRLGGYLGAWPVLGELLLTALLGLFVLRRQGGAALRRTLVDLQRGELQLAGLAAGLVEGLLLSVAGLLLLLPGLITDGLGLLLLIPACRRLAGRRLAWGAVFHGAGPHAERHAGRSRADASVIEGEFERLDPDAPGGADAAGSADTPVSHRPVPHRPESDRPAPSDTTDSR